MVQCPSCKSWCAGEAAFCSQCGGRLEKRQGRRPKHSAARNGRRLFFLALGGIAAALAVVIYIAVTPDGAQRSAGSDPVASNARERGREPGDGDGLDASDRPSQSVAESAPRPLDPAALERLVASAQVILDLRTDDDRPLREERGYIVDSRGVVLCRFRPLLGAHHGICRLSVPREARVEITGLSWRDEALDLALIRIGRSAAGFPMISLLEDAPSDVLSQGDPIHVLSGEGLEETSVSEAYYPSPDRVARIRLAAAPELAPDSLLAVDAYGYAVGLVRFEAEGGRMLLDGRPPPGVEHRPLVDPATSAARALDLEVGLSLDELTRRLYEGTFPDHMARGLSAWRRKDWAEAIGHFEQALERVPVDRPGDEDVDLVTRTLLECYREEVARLAAAGRMDEAAVVAEGALARYPDEHRLMVVVGEVRCGRKDWVGGIQALVQAREIQASEKVDALLQDAFLMLAGEASRAGDTRGMEARLIEGIQQLPASAALRIELAKLYMQFEAYDDATRLLQDAKGLDPALREASQALLDRIDDALKRRDAVIIPIPRGSRSIRTEAVLDGTRTYPFIVDTGATYTTVPADIAQALGYDLSRATQINVSTAGGVLSVPLIQVQSVSLGGYAVRNLEVCVIPSGLGPDFGLLGLNFLKHFKYSMDSARNEFRLERP